MTHTLAAVFETRAEANQAKDELVHSGFDRDTITVSDSGSVAGTPRINDDESILGSIKHMFSQLLGREHGDRHVYAEALNRGHVVLTVHTDSMDAADRAAGIVEDFHPIDIDERETMWRASGWTGAEMLRSGSGMQQTSVGAQQSAPVQHGIRPREEAVDFARSEQGLVTPGSMQRGEAADTPVAPPASTPISEQSTVQRSGMRIYPREVGDSTGTKVGTGSDANAGTSSDTGSGANAGDTSGMVSGADVGSPNQDSLNIQRGDEGGDSDDDYFRSHWQDSYAYTGGTYQEYDLAYRYGASMAGSSAYHGLPWEHAEPELRGTWEHTYPLSAWDKFKDAVQTGWERVTK